MFVNAQRIPTFCGDQEAWPDRVASVTMSKSPQIEKVQPCLLDRLIDERPEVRTETTGRGISLSRYRQGVLRDIEWLLNAKSRLAHEGFADFPETETSVLNFGMPDPAGRSTDRQTIAQIEKDIAAALLRFEPRIIADSLVVKLIETSTSQAPSSPNLLAFSITGELWASPMNEELHLKTEIDLETGKCRL
jgi:type VI secretion system protein ImpF